MAGRQARHARQPKAIIGYVRVSTDGQGKDGISLDLQRAAIREYAHRSNLPLIEIYEDVASGAGARSVVSREGLQHALQACRDFDGLLVVWDWSRLSRHAASEKEITDILPAQDRVLSLHDGETLPDAAKHARFVHAEAERNEISRRTKEAMENRKRDGAVFGNPNIKNAQKSGTMAAQQKSDEIVREIADFLKSSGDPSKLTRSQVIAYLNAKGIRTLHGNDWDLTRIRVPLLKARALIKQQDEEAMQTLQVHPHFALF